MKKIVYGLIITSAFLSASAALAQGPGSLPGPNKHVTVGQLPSLNNNRDKHTTVGEINQSYYESTRNSSLTTSTPRETSVNNDHTNVGDINESARRNQRVTGVIVIEKTALPAEPITTPETEKPPQ